LTFNVEAGTLYKIYAYYYNRNSTVTISSIVYTHTSDLTTLSLANDSGAGAIAVNGVAGVTSCNVQKGEYVKLSVTPNAGSIFGGWKNANEEIVSEDAEFWVLAEDAISLTTTWRTADVHNFVWNPAVASGNWNDSANWLYEGVAPSVTYPSDVSQDVAIFNSEATVTLAANATASNVLFNAAATLTGGTLTAVLVDGEGAVTLANAGFANPSDLVQTNHVAIVMTAGTTNWFNTVGTTEALGKLYIKGNISGEGCFKVQLATTRQCNAYFQGNNNEFSGDVYTSGGTVNRSVIYWSENAVGTNTFLHIGHSYGTYNEDKYRMGGSVKFGGVEGGWWDRYDGNVLTIGYLNRDSSINLSNGVSGRANSVTKVGTANLTLGTTCIKNLTVNGGSVTMPIGIAPNTLTLAAGTEIRIPGDAAWTAGTVTNLFSYTTLLGATSATLPRQVEVTGLGKGLKAKISVEDNTVKATIQQRCGFMILLQ
jgi:uncharacterized protein YaiE (UPF0345 family)